jgi:uncharacterized protein (DUF983 family)
MMEKKTIRCPKCGKGTACRPQYWIDFGNWVGGPPRSIACAHCGEQIPLPVGDDPRSEAFSVIGILVGIVVLAVALTVGAMVLRFIGA